MEITLKTKLHLRSQNLKIKSEDGISIIYDSKAAAGLLMKEALIAHSSVVVFGKKPDYYHYVKDYCPDMVGRYYPQQIRDELRWPWIENISEKTVFCMEECLTEANMQRYGIHLRSLNNKYKIKDPSTCLSFYQIDDTGTRRDRVLVELLLIALLLQNVNQEPVRETCFFIDAPYHPFTTSGILAIKEAASYDIPIVMMYPDNGKKFDTAYNCLFEKKGNIYLKSGRKRFLVTP